MRSLAEDRQSRSSRQSGINPDLSVRHALPPSRFEKRVEQQRDRVEEEKASIRLTFFSQTGAAFCMVFSCLCTFSSCGRNF